MFKKIFRNHRQSKNFTSSFIATTLVSYLFGIYFTKIFEQVSFFDWNTHSTQIVLSTIALVILLPIFYMFFYRWCEDKKDRQNFYENFFMSIIIVIIVSLMLFFRNCCDSWLFYLISLGIIILIYFPLNWSYIKLRQKIN